MKKLLSLVLVLFLLTACNGDIAPSSDTSADKVSSTASTIEEASSTDVNDTASTESAIKKNATVIIDYADNTLYDEVSFSEDGANYNLIFFTNVAVKNFTLLEMDESEMLKVVDPMWCIDEFTPEKPVIVSTWLNDATISRDISYTDQNGEEHVFSIVLSMKDESVSLVDFKEQTTKDESAPSEEPKEQKTLTVDEAFDAFLKGEISTVNTDGKDDRYIYDYCRIGDGGLGIGSYAFCDFTGDGVHEMLIAATGKEILMYQDGKLVTIYESGTNGQHGPIVLLENGAMLEEHTTFETMYTYTTFDSDGTSNKTEFGLLEYEDETQSEYWFGEYDEKVTKEEFDELTKDIFAAAEKEAKLDWIEWTPPSNWEELRGY